MMHWKRFGRKGLWPSTDSVLTFAWRFCHPRTEQKWHLEWNSKSSETLGHNHCEAGGLYRRTV